MHIYTSIVRDGEWSWTLRIALLVSLLTATYYSVPVTTSASRRVYWMSLSSEQRRQRHQPGRDHENTTASSRGHNHWVQTSFVRSHDTFTASFSQVWPDVRYTSVWSGFGTVKEMCLYLYTDWVNHAWLVLNAYCNISWIIRPFINIVYLTALLQTHRPESSFSWAHKCKCNVFLCVLWA